MTGAVFQPELIELNLRDHQQNDDVHYVPQRKCPYDTSTSSRW